MASSLTTARPARTLPRPDREVTEPTIRADAARRRTCYS